MDKALWDTILAGKDPNEYIYELMLTAGPAMLIRDRYDEKKAVSVGGSYKIDEVTSTYVKLSHRHSQEPFDNSRTFTYLRIGCIDGIVLLNRP